MCRAVGKDCTPGRIFAFILDLATVWPGIDCMENMLPSLINKTHEVSLRSSQAFQFLVSMSKLQRQQDYKGIKSS